MEILMDIIETIKMLKNSGIDVTVHVEFQVVLTGENPKELSETTTKSYTKPNWMTDLVKGDTP